MSTLASSGFAKTPDSTSSLIGPSLAMSFEMLWFEERALMKLISILPQKGSPYLDSKISYDLWFLNVKVQSFLNYPVLDELN
ncbi:hypothetical protein JKY72_06455 [Candidatus Gracilibacteria bacterium]|nr:hypothetical protein [Candidatus Gracilibacteria bacterium]